MNKKHMGISLEAATKELEKKHPGLRVAIDQYKEKIEMANLLRNLREKEHVSQVELAEMADVPQSVISRIESHNSRTLPRLDLFTRLISTLGYRITLNVEKQSRLRRPLATA